MLLHLYPWTFMMRLRLFKGEVAAKRRTKMNSNIQVDLVRLQDQIDFLEQVPARIFSFSTIR